VDQLAVAVDQAEIGNWPTPTVQEAGKIGNQANHGQIALSNHPSLRGEVNREKFKKCHSGHPAPVNPNTDLSRPESWPTPTALNRVRDEETMEKCLKFRQGNGQTSVPLYLEEKVNLEEKSWEMPTGGHRQKDGSMTPKLDQQVKSWAKPQASDHIEGERTAIGSNQKCLGRDLNTWATPQADYSTKPMHPERMGGGQPTLKSQTQTGTGKLNPRWVETLMGLPVGWTMPSCASPVTIEPTNCDSSETESCPQPQP
jgi:hypothetical protein